jgi:DNA invertase Pin-like site-specific DNA recombinase/succinate dehydrogenase flavin-adding protein (antitoxin of CptAB toxin-antitoxin module)
MNRQLSNISDSKYSGGQHGKSQHNNSQRTGNRSTKNSVALANRKIYLYGRLSNEDAKHGDSYSIINQRKILSQYAEERGFKNWEFIYDDGFSGGDWERPAFKKMIEEVESGLVSTIIVKDLSRFGRGYLQSGFYQEILFPKMDVRLISIHENLDSDEGENDITPVINLFNEWFLKSTSQKIRAVKHSKGQAGERMAVIPKYGYRKHPDNPKQLIIDEESAVVVKRIFQMIIDGLNAVEVARVLMAERHLNPSAYKYEKGIISKPRPMKDPYLWNTTSVHKILDTQEYLGHTINFKTYTKSYKDNKCRINPPEKQMVFENTHEPIIDTTTWEIVKKMRQTKRRSPRYGKIGLFMGLAYCSDCKAKLYYHTRELHTKKATRYEGAYSCSNYRKAIQYHEPRLCTCHYITEVALAKIVIENLRQVLAFAKNHEMEFAKIIMEKNEIEQKREIEIKKKLLHQKRKRIEELDNIFERIYEDNISGKLSDERFSKMSAKYEQEQQDIRAEIPNLEAIVTSQETKLGDINKFLSIVQKYTEIQELTPAITNEFIDKIIVHEPEKAKGKDRTQKIEIIYNGVGNVEIPTHGNIKSIS